MADERKYKDQENIPMTEDEIKQMIESEQDRAYNNFEEESWDLAGITSEEFKKHMESYDEKDDLHKYLVNGAKLTCTQVTNEPFEISEVGSFCVEEISDMDEHLYTKLNVSENPMGINGQPYATVNDTVQGRNILPFTGNCRVPANGSEKETIMIQLEYGIRRDGTWKQPGVKGVCECLMQLNEQWDNMFFADGGDYCINRIDTDPEGKKKPAKGITRTSVLFCKHGGLIVPVTSGQDVVKPSFVLMQLEISVNPIALYNTSLEPANVLRTQTQGKIQKMCNGEIIYFDADGYQRVKNTGLESDPYLVAIGEYYSSSAVSNGVGDYQGYGAIFKVTYITGKEIYVTMGDLKDPKDTKTSMEQEGKNFYAGKGDSANTLEFICNYLNKNTGNYSENMSSSAGSDAYHGKAYTITEGARISEIDLLIGKEIVWEEYFGYNY